MFGGDVAGLPRLAVHLGQVGQTPAGIPAGTPSGTPAGHRPGHPPEHKKLKRNPSRDPHTDPHRELKTFAIRVLCWDNSLIAFR